MTQLVVVGALQLGNKVNSDEIIQLFRQADVDGSGAISYNELLMTAVQRKLLAKEERLWDTFKRMDLVRACLLASCVYEGWHMRPLCGPSLTVC